MSGPAWTAFRGQRVLLLQGPVGPFFRRLSKLLIQVGAKVHKVNFNGGDCLFYPTDSITFHGSLQAWPDFLASLLERLEIDVILLFGDCRPIHLVAREIATRRGVKVGAFEEGYIRPNFITLEPDGVNGYSNLSRAFKSLDVPATAATSEERSVGHTFCFAACWAVLYYCAAAALRTLFRQYRHHRPLSLTEAWPWILGGWRKLIYALAERGVLGKLTGRLSKRFFLVPLQVSCDSQISQHSEFASVPEFILRVVASFAENAPKDTTLVIKHHPLDRGYHCYDDLIGKLAQEYDLVHRVLYIHDQHLPTLFDHMRGTVVINSTVGFSALSHGAPVKTCGRAIYDMTGITFQGSLNEFWHQAQGFRPDHQLFLRFRAFVIDQTQINGNFYKGRIQTGSCAFAVASASNKAATSFDGVPESEEYVRA
jgi:capsular polysaccharide export protein